MEKGGGGQCEIVHDDCRLPSQAESVKARAVHRFLIGSREADVCQLFATTDLCEAQIRTEGMLAHGLNEMPQGMQAAKQSEIRHGATSIHTYSLHDQTLHRHECIVCSHGEPRLGPQLELSLCSADRYHLTLLLSEVSCSDLGQPDLTCFQLIKCRLDPQLLQLS